MHFMHSFRRKKEGEIFYIDLCIKNALQTRIDINKLDTCYWMCHISLLHFFLKIHFMAYFNVLHDFDDLQAWMLAIFESS